MAHLGSSFTSFESFLNRADVTGIWSVDLAALNNSGVTGDAVFATNLEADGSRYLNVSITVQGMEANVPVPQHIHGLFSDMGMPIDTQTPTLANDVDGDGFIEVLEGLTSYGDIILTLTENGSAPMTDAAGQFTYIQNFDLNDDSLFGSPVSGNDYTAMDIMPLEFRELVLHGINVPAGQGAGTTGEVNGMQDGFVPILPAAAGTIEVIDQAQALDILEDQLAVASDALALGDEGGMLSGGLGNDTLTGGAGEDTLDGGADGDVMSGGLGNDRYIVDSAGDMITGEIGFSQGGGIDTVMSSVSYTLGANLEILRLTGTDDINGTGGFAPEALVGNVGNNMLDGGGGNDVLNGKAGDDILVGGLGADSLVGDAGADVFDFNTTSESGPGQTSRDFINGFVHGEDKIDLSDIDANVASMEDDAFTFVDNAAFSGTAGELRWFTFSGGNFNIVEADVDGDGSADMQVFVNLTDQMFATDFVL